MGHVLFVLRAYVLLIRPLSVRVRNWPSEWCGWSSRRIWNPRQAEGICVTVWSSCHCVFVSDEKDKKLPTNYWTENRRLHCFWNASCVPGVVMLPSLLWCHAWCRFLKRRELSHTAVHTIIWTCVWKRRRISFFFFWGGEGEVVAFGANIAPSFTGMIRWSLVLSFVQMWRTLWMLSKPQCHYVIHTRYVTRLFRVVKPVAHWMFDWQTEIANWICPEDPMWEVSCKNVQ